jgi:hypothetical protein
MSGDEGLWDQIQSLESQLAKCGAEHLAAEKRIAALEEALRNTTDALEAQERAYFEDVSAGPGDLYAPSPMLQLARTAVGVPVAEEEK